MPIHHQQLSREELIQFALKRNEGETADNGALVVRTGARTGRSPKDRFIVRDATTEHTVAWNLTNQPISSEKFQSLWTKAEHYLQALPEYFSSQLRVGASEKYTIPVVVYSELAWHQLFAQTLFIRETLTHYEQSAWTVLSVPGLKPNGAEDGVNSDAAVILNFSERKILITGTYYAGEMKKAMFSILNYLLPEHDVLPMHCAANADKNGNTALFFGLSGTGKTTLSADPDRFLIGDDEHGWGSDGIFNFEGGCYAKCIDLSKEREPLIWNAIRHGTIIENVMLNANKQPVYSDTSLTQNSRAAYPLEFIAERVEENKGQQPSAVIFLTCDLCGVIPPVSKLTTEQAAYYFLSGYTALVGSTEVGQGTGIKLTFSTCFGAPFFPRPAAVYAELLMKRLKEHPAQVYLVNTGWTGGAHGEGGKRFDIPVTRRIVSAILNGELNSGSWETLSSGFKFTIPKHIKGIDVSLLNPRNTWKNAHAYDEKSTWLIQQFMENFKKFQVSERIVNAGPELS